LSPESDKPIRVLFVEDAFDQALLVKAFLQSRGGFEVTHSQDGLHAVTLLKEREWDLVITDLNLPGIDGFEVCRVARTVAKPPPVLAVTGYTGAHYQEEAFRAGATELLTKPLDRDEFLGKVADLTGSGGPPTLAQQRVVLAVGGLVGDSEMGCGGTLVKEREQGAAVIIVPLCRDEMDASGYGLQGAMKAAAILGARVVVDELALDDTQRRVALLDRLVRDTRPEVVFIPAMDDAHPARREAFRIAKMLLPKVPRMLTYQTATTGMEFRPSRFEDVADQMVQKMEALAAYQAAGAPRMDLAPRLAQAFARYWGRFERFGEVEAFEVMSDGD
jgi:two-component system, NtrC family, response regulator HydG